MIALLLGATGSIWAVWYYLERSKSRRLKKAKKDLNIDPEDEVYNLVMSTKSICKVMKRDGHDVSAAEILLERAELALQADDYPKAMKLAEDAKKKIAQSKDISIQPSNTNTLVPEEDKPKSKAVKKFEERKEEIQNLPENYLESKFEIEVARDMVKETDDVEASRLLQIAEDKFSSKDYTGALSQAIKCKKWIDEDSAGLLAGQKIGKKKKPAEESKTLSLKELPATESEGQHECSECGNQVSESDKFCNKCGAKIHLLQTCAACGAEVEISYNFCSECGEELGLVVYECPECGTEVDDDVQFCPQCGVELE